MIDPLCFPGGGGHLHVSAFLHNLFLNLLQVQIQILEHKEKISGTRIDTQHKLLLFQDRGGK